jgi:hypothetical protein
LVELGVASDDALGKDQRDAVAEGPPGCVREGIGVEVPVPLGTNQSRFSKEFGGSLGAQSPADPHAKTGDGEDREDTADQQRAND